MSNEQERIKNKGEQIKLALRMAGNRGMTNVELSKMALRYGGYLGKLYEEGYEIDKEFLGEGVYKYTLISEPEEKVVRVSAIDKLFKEIEHHGVVTRKMLEKIMKDNRIAVKYKANTYK